jgi:pimeloyl-ACP methyl ester carboxylesterase
MSPRPLFHTYPRASIGAGTRVMHTHNNFTHCDRRCRRLATASNEQWLPFMPDGIDVMVPGSSAIATEALLEQHDQLGTLEFLLHSVESLVSEAWAIGATSATHSMAMAGAVDDLIRCASDVQRARNHAIALQRSLSTAAAQYGAAEESAEQFADLAAGVVGTVAGTALADLLSALGPAALLLPLVFHQNPSDDENGPNDIHVSPELNRALSDPATVDLIRAGVTGLDDFFRAFGRVPMPLGDYLGTGDDEAGQVTAAAAALLAGGRLFGLFGATPTKASLLRTEESASAPTSIVQLIDGIPGSEPGQQSGNVRIDHVTSGGTDDRYIVYIGGTDDFSAVSRDRALDLTSNVEGIAGAPTGSMQALEQAMRDSGIDSTSRVTFVGHSQGGLLASAATASGKYTVDGLLTIGNPAGNIETPANVPALLIAHDEDLVTALGGNQTNDNAMRISRRVFDSSAEVPGDLAVPAHHIEYYRHTASLIDAATSDDVVSMVKSFTSFSTASTHVESRWYDATRVSTRD